MAKYLDTPDIDAAIAMYAKHGLRLVRTCTACPEQYDVFNGNTQVGYLRLRHGEFRASCPDYNGKTVYTCCTVGDGMFDDDVERMCELRHAMNAINYELHKEENKMAKAMTLREIKVAELIHKWDLQDSYNIQSAIKEAISWQARQSREALEYFHEDTTDYLAYMNMLYNEVENAGTETPFPNELNKEQGNDANRTVKGPIE